MLADGADGEPEGGYALPKPPAWVVGSASESDCGSAPMPMNISHLNYDLKQDRAIVILNDNDNGHVSVQISFALKTGEGLKEKQLEERMRDEAKKHLQAALAAL